MMARDDDVEAAPYDTTWPSDLLGSSSIQCRNVLSSSVSLYWIGPGRDQWILKSLLVTPSLSVGKGLESSRSVIGRHQCPTAPVRVHKNISYVEVLSPSAMT